MAVKSHKNRKLNSNQSIPHKFSVKSATIWTNGINRHQSGVCIKIHLARMDRQCNGSLLILEHHIRKIYFSILIVVLNKKLFQFIGNRCLQMCVYIYDSDEINKWILRQKDFDCKFLSFKLQLKVLLQSGGKEINPDQPWS